MYYVYVLCILYTVYVLCNVTKNNTNKTIIITRVLGARGGRQSSNPAKETTHSRKGEKETHYMNVVGKKVKNSKNKYSGASF